MSNPQMLTLIGVLAALMFAMHRLTVREMSARFEAVDARFEAIIGRFDAKFEAVDARFKALESVMVAKFDAVDHRLTAVEADLSVIKGTLINQRSA